MNYYFPIADGVEFASATDRLYVDWWSWVPMIECPCCNRKVTQLMKNVWVSEPVCRECLYVWYNEGMIDPKEIKKRVLSLNEFCLEYWEKAFLEDGPGPTTILRT